MATGITYNGYTFGDYSQVTCKIEPVFDEAGRTVTTLRHTFRVVTTIVAEAIDGNVGDHFKRIRQKLTKAGQQLTVDILAFSPQLSVNTGYGARDVEFGPKPKLVEWTPIGASNAVEVVWEVTASIPTCDGYSGSPRYGGLMALNYAISYAINEGGFTTRTVSGYLEIAMTRNGRSIYDTADNYRDKILIPDLVDFQRTTTWNISADKRRADFAIVDKEIESPNKYPYGVIKIKASHRVRFERKTMAKLANNVSATIQLAANQPKSRAWQIFRGIFTSRIQAAAANADYPRPVFIESLDIEEQLYDYQVSFSLNYYILKTSVSEIFTATGLFSDVPVGNWIEWKNSVHDLQSHRGIAQLSHNPSEDQIVDLCTDQFLMGESSPYNVPTPTPTPYQRYCNDRPPADQSWLRFQGYLTTIEDNATVEQITVGRDDMPHTDFDPSNPVGSNGGTDQDAGIKRFIESAPGSLEFVWEGYAERVGYDIPRPDKITIAGKTLIRKGRQEFRKRRIGTFFCQPVYAAAWRMRYVIDSRPPTTDAGDADPVNSGPGNQGGFL